MRGVEENIAQALHMIDKPLQLFTNIFDNSVKSMNGSHVTINVSCKRTHDWVEIVIDDDGLDINERNLPNILNIF